MMNSLKFSGLTAVAASFICCNMLAGTVDGNKVHLKGQLVDMGTTDVPMRFDGAASMLGESRNIMLKTDAKGNFDTVIELDKPAYFNISRNTVYLSPGDDLTVKITQNNGEAEFAGKGAEANIYMKGRLFRMEALSLKVAIIYVLTLPLRGLLSTAWHVSGVRSWKL